MIFPSGAKLVSYPYSHILEEEITPLILVIEEEPQHKHHVHQADEDDDEHARVHSHLIPASAHHPAML